MVDFVTTSSVLQPVANHLFLLRWNQKQMLDGGVRNPPPKNAHFLLLLLSLLRQRCGRDKKEEEGKGFLPRAQVGFGAGAWDHMSGGILSLSCATKSPVFALPSPQTPNCVDVIAHYHVTAAPETIDFVPSSSPSPTPATTYGVMTISPLRGTCL